MNVTFKIFVYLFMFNIIISTVVYIESVNNINVVQEQIQCFKQCEHNKTTCSRELIKPIIPDYIDFPDIKTYIIRNSYYVEIPKSDPTIKINFSEDKKTQFDEAHFYKEVIDCYYNNVTINLYCKCYLNLSESKFYIIYVISIICTLCYFIFGIFQE